MSFLLDTNAWITYLSRRDSPLKRRFAEHAPGEMRTCSVVRAELYYGAMRSSDPQHNIALIDRVCALFESIPFDDVAAREYARVRDELEKLGRPIGPNDLMIAAIARANRLTLVTHNTAEFGRVTGLTVEDGEI